jgi:hypothetical protein
MRTYRFGPTEQAPGEWETMVFEAANDEQAIVIARLALKGRGPYPATSAFIEAVERFGPAMLFVEYRVAEFAAPARRKR